MIIPEDERGYERVAILNEHAMEAHQPSWGRMPRYAAAGYVQPENLAARASVLVDSFYGTLNLSTPAELYPALNQVALRWSPAEKAGLAYIHLSTHTPNFACFEWRFDGGPWRRGLDTALAWSLHPGENLFEVQVRNRAGKAGRTSRLKLGYAPGTPTSSQAGNLAVIEEINGAAAPSQVPFSWEVYHHPRLVALRERYNLDELVAGARSDLERALRLRDWVKSRWDHSQPIRLPPWDALFMLERVDKGIEAYYCVHYSVVFMQCCLSLGIPARLLNLARGIGPAELDRRAVVFKPVVPPIDEHVVNEVWLDDLGRWAMMDVDFDLHYTREGFPVSALEIHQALLAGELDRLEVCEGPLAFKLRSSAELYPRILPTYYAHFCVFWRNNHLTDPQGPTQVLHWVDPQTPAMLWWEGSDLRHRPEIIGPAVVAWPYACETPRLTDGNIATCWASEEIPQVHWVELCWPEPQRLSRVVIDWAECWQRYWTSQAYTLQAWQAGAWQDLVQVTGNREAAYTAHSFPALITDRIRLLQPGGGGAPERPNLLWLAEIEVFE